MRKLAAGGGQVGFGELDLKILALPYLLDPLEAQSRQGQLNRLPLRIKDTLLQRDVNDGAHASVRGRLVQG